MVEHVENRVVVLDGKQVSVIEIRFQSGKRLKLVFDDKDEHLFYDDDQEKFL